MRTLELFDGERQRGKRAAAGGGGSGDGAAGARGDGAARGARPVVVCNGELERSRSNYYPPFWNAGEMGPVREFAKQFEGIYFIHNFKAGLH